MMKKSVITTLPSIATIVLLLSQIQCHAFAVTPSSPVDGIGPTSSTDDDTPLTPKPKTLPTPPKDIWPQLVVGGKEDPAMGFVEQNQRSAGKKYGKVLDAGTGIYSLRWLASLLYRHSDPDDELHMTSFVAVTADENFRRDCQAKAEELGVSEWGEIVRGNWDDDYMNDVVKNDGDDGDDDGNRKTLLCEGQMFDTILADYLVGAVDHFSPFFQDLLFKRLCSHLKQGGIMHLTGLNPIPERVDGPGNIFCKITKLRDACILLAGARPYREYPADWVQRHLEMSGLEVINVSTFEKTYDYNMIKLQIDACRSTLRFIDDVEVRYAMSKKIDRIDEETKQICEKCPDGKFTLGYDWVITAIKR